MEAMICGSRRATCLAWLIVVLMASPIAIGGESGADGAAEEASDDQKPFRLRVLSYNIHHAEGIDGRLDLRRIAGTITAVAPDVVALQEVDRRTERTERVDQAAELARLTEMHVAFGGNLDYQGGKYGNAILSRFRIARQENHLLPSRDDGEPRGVLEVEIELPGLEGPLLMLATHLDHRRNDLERRESAAAINHLVANRSAQPALLAGDLNDTPESATLKRLASEWSRAGERVLPTVPVDTPKRQIDYVLFRPENRWRVVDVRVLKERVASDHRAILAVLEWLPAEADL